MSEQPDKEMLALAAISLLAMGFVLGYATNPDDGHDDW